MSVIEKTDETEEFYSLKSFIVPSYSVDLFSNNNLLNLFLTYNYFLVIL
jgi:hypothetical protein